MPTLAGTSHAPRAAHRVDPPLPGDLPSDHTPSPTAHSQAQDPRSLPAGGPPDTPTPPRHDPILDPGWLFLLSGLILIAATVLIPAQRERDQARLYLQRASAAAEHRQARLARYHQFAQAARNADPTLVSSLAAMQLNLAPDGTELLLSSGEIPSRSASVFASLEPPPLVLPQAQNRPVSRLERWTTSPTARLWLLGAAAMLILLGLLPPARPSPRTP